MARLRLWIECTLVAIVAFLVSTAVDAFVKCLSLWMSPRLLMEDPLTVSEVVVDLVQPMFYLNVAMLTLLLSVMIFNRQWFYPWQPRIRYW